MAENELMSVCRKQAGRMQRVQRELHAWPELSGREFRTVETILRELTALGLTWERIPDGGVLAWIDTGDPAGPRVLLRADCDALPIGEDPHSWRGERDVISQVPGCAHLCGHDAHTAMLLGAAAALKELDLSGLRGRIGLLFERGEEGGLNYYYIMQYLRSHGIAFDTCFALHAEPQLPLGSIWAEEGPCHAGNVNFEIRLQGKAGHGSRPDLANNPLDCFVAVMNDINGFRMKHIPPQDILTINVGSVHCGTKRNIVPESLECKGTCRFYRRENGQVFKDFLQRAVTLEAELYGCRAEFQVLSGPSLPQLNHPGASRLAGRAFAKWIPELQQVREKEPEMSSETFGVYSAWYPGTMALIGIADPAGGPCAGLHSPQFEIPPELLPLGAAAHAAYALTFLEEQPKLAFTPFDGDIDDMMRLTHRTPPARQDPYTGIFF